MNTRPFAIVTGASTGIGLELAREAASRGYDLLLAADEPLDQAAGELRALGAEVDTLQADLATRDGIEQLYARAKGRDRCVARQRRARPRQGLPRSGIRRGAARHQHQRHRHARPHPARGAPDAALACSGKILITGSIAGFMPGTFQAVYNGTKAFIDSFSYALRRAQGHRRDRDLPDAGRHRYGLLRARRHARHQGRHRGKGRPADVAKTGFDAMEEGEAGVVAGLSATSCVPPRQRVAGRGAGRAAPQDGRARLGAQLRENIMDGGAQAATYAALTDRERKGVHENRASRPAG